MSEATSGTGRGRVSVLFAQRAELEDIIAYARLCERYDLRLWLGQLSGIESHAALAAVAGRGVSVETGLGVAIAPLRTPLDAYTQARSIATLMDRPISAGYGMGSADLASRLLGREFTGPAAYMASYVEQVRGFNRSGTESSPVEVGCGVLRPRMAREAGRVADFAITWLTPLNYLATTLREAIETGAATAARPRPRIVAVVQCALARPDRDPAHLAYLGCGRHLGAPHYADMLRTAGVELTGDRASDLRAALRAGLFSYGTAEELVATINSYWRVGVDEVVLNVGSVGLAHGTAAALRDIEQIRDAIEPADSVEPMTIGR